jgi:predicted nucleic acid-binding protein
MKSQPDEHVLHWLDAQSGNDLFISAITKAEIELGIALLPHGKRRSSMASAANLMFTQDFAHRVLSFDEIAASFYAELVSHRLGLGRPISVEEPSVSAINITQPPPFSHVLVTHNGLCW